MSNSSKRLRQGTGVILLSLTASACAIPHGSFARPVNPVNEGGSMISIGGVAPFAVAGSASTNDTDLAEVVDGLVLVPAGAFDYAIGDRNYLGVEVSLYNTFTTSSPTDSTSFGLFVNPRWELGLSDNVSFTVDLNLGYFQTDSGDSVSSTPFFLPAIGTRIYLPTGFGGFVWSQQFTTAIITVATPGSLAYDIPIPMGGPTLHLFPEFRYDPTFVVIGDVAGVVAIFSGGLTVMLEL